MPNTKEAPCVCGCSCGAIAREIRGALDAELTYLTVRERALFDGLFEELGDYVERRVAARTLYRSEYIGAASDHAFNLHLFRLRRKLSAHDAPWAVDSIHGAIRLRALARDVDAAFAA